MAGTRQHQAYLSSVPKFLREKLRGFVDAAEGPLADWIPTIPPPSVSVSTAVKSLRTFSMLSLSFSKTNASENKKKTHNNNKRKSHTATSVLQLQLFIEEMRL